MEINDDLKQQYLNLIKDSENREPKQLIKIQIQNVARELSKLLGILEGGITFCKEDSPEYVFINSEEIKVIRESGSDCLRQIVKAARKKNINLQ